MSHRAATDSGAALPSPLTSMVGRSDEIEPIVAMLRDVRLVTLTGPGGAGKTRLAIAVAAMAASSFADGVVYVPLASIRDPALVLGEIASACGFRLVKGQSVFARLRAALAATRSLIVLDNIEQVIDAGGDVARLLDACPGVRIVATGRSAFRIYGEQRVPVAPLPVPSDGPVTVEAARTFGAVDLFVQRAKSARPDFALTSENVATVVEICRRLDGLPLAIELAAARIRVLSPEALRAHLTNRLVLLTGGAVDQPARLQTMRAAIAWSYELLAPEAQRLFRSLSVFTGGFTQAAVSEVAFSQASGERDSVAVLDALTDLADRSLIAVDPHSNGQSRFMMLETIAEFGRERLAEHGEEASMKARHARFAQEVAETASALLARKVDIQVLRYLDNDRDNLRAALTWLDASGDRKGFVQLAGALGDFWYLQGYVAEGRDYLRRALSMGPVESTSDWLRAVAWSGSLAQLAGDSVRAERDLGEALALARSADDDWTNAFACMELGAIAEDGGRFEAAERWYREALAHYRSPEDVTWIASAWYHLGIVAFGAGDHAAARERLERSLAMADLVDEPWSRLRALTYLGIVAIDTGALDRALAVLRTARSLVPLAASTDGLATVLATFATLATRQGRFGPAARLFGAAERGWAVIGSSPRQPELRVFAGAGHDVDLALGQVDARTFRDLGGAMTVAECHAALDDVIANPAETLPPRRRGRMDSVSIPSDDSDRLGQLTRREREVLGLLSKGLTDRQIAAELSISHLTARTHVRNVLAKLDCATRGAAAAFAVRHRVI